MQLKQENSHHQKVKISKIEKIIEVTRMHSTLGAHYGVRIDVLVNKIADYDSPLVCNFNKLVSNNVISIPVSAAVQPVSMSAVLRILSLQLLCQLTQCVTVVNICSL